MSLFWNHQIRNSIRKILLNLLAFTDNKTGWKSSASLKEPFFRRNIHIPPVIVLAVSTPALLLIPLWWQS